MSNLGPNFYPKLVQMSAELGMNPEDLLVVMVGESGLNPAAVEKTFKGSGLVGFMPDTLKGLGFKGTWEDFIKLSGEQQLDYVKKLVTNFAKLNGGPLKSAAQYYTANFWPIALKLPGVQQGNIDTPIVELNPKAIKLTDGSLLSKKYYNVGQKISVKMESGAYKANQILDKNKDGAITYGDMLERVNDHKKHQSYKQALRAMQQQTGYVPKEKKEEVAVKSKSNITLPNVIDQLNVMMTSLDGALSAAAVKQLLPNNFIIKVNGSNLINGLEFARILSSTINDCFGESEIFHHQNSIEIESNIPGHKKLAAESLVQLCQALSEDFEQATQKIGSVKVTCQIVPNEFSTYAELDIDTAQKYYDLFHSQFKKVT